MTTMNNLSRWKAALKHPTRYFPTTQSFRLKKFLTKLSPKQKEALVQYVPLKIPYICMMLSFCLVFFGVDRWYVGDKWLAIIKVISMLFGIGGFMVSIRHLLLL